MHHLRPANRAKSRSLEWISACDSFSKAARWASVVRRPVARDCAMRGLETALVDASDFGAATSANSLKVVHGGIRHLQHGDLAELRSSARERATWHSRRMPS